MNLPAKVSLRSDRVVQITVPFRFLTPVFGGGISSPRDGNGDLPGLDQITPIRASGVRGQLRYWWRATIGCRQPSLESMKRREAEIWGGIWNGQPTKGAVSVSVKRKGKGKPSSINVDNLRHPLSYGAISTPVRVFDYGDEQFVLVLNVKSSAGLTIDDVKADVDVAVAAWLSLGGYGSRTSRGFGAVAACTPAQVVGGDRHQIGVLSFAILNGPINVPGIPAVVNDTARYWISDRPCESTKQAQEKGLAILKKFRQGNGVGRNFPQNGRHAGRSRWPEADAIRARVPNLVIPPNRNRINQGDGFPRAEFGLPIIFEFMGEKTPRCTLNFSPDGGRFASPLLLRPTSEGKILAFWLTGVDLPRTLALSGTGSAGPDSVSPKASMNVLNNSQRRLVDPHPIAAFLNFCRNGQPTIP